jgi:hypothetical protein
VQVRYVDAVCSGGEVTVTSVPSPILDSITIAPPIESNLA